MRKTRKILACISLLALLLSMPIAFAAASSASIEDANTKFVLRDVSVRLGPNSKKYDVVGKVSACDEVEVLEIAGKWSKINYKGEEAYVFSKYLTSDEAKAYKNHPIVKLLGSNKIKSISIIPGMVDHNDPHYSQTLTGRWSESHDADSFDSVRIVIVDLKKPYTKFTVTIAIYQDSETALSKYEAIAAGTDMLDSSWRFYCSGNLIVRWRTAGGLDEYSSTEIRFGKQMQAKFIEYFG